MNSEKEKFFGPADFFKTFGKNHIKMTVIFLYAVFAVTFWKYLPSNQLPENPSASPVFYIPYYSDAVARGLELEKKGEEVPLTLFLIGEQKIFAAFILMGLIPMGIVKWGFREKLSDYGITFGHKMQTLISILVFTPLMFFIAYSSAGPGNTLVYPFNPLAAHANGWRLALHLGIYFFCYYFAWEFMFRGFLLKGLIPECSLLPAIFIQAVLATMVHYGHPLSETLGCIGGSIFWGTVVIRTKSILPGWIQHAALGLTIDFLITKL